VLKKDKIKRRLSIGRIKTEDERLVERVLESIKSYLLDIERSLNKPIREYSTQYIQLAEAVNSQTFSQQPIRPRNFRSLS